MSGRRAIAPRDERGFALTELMIAMALMIVVLGGILTPLDGLWSTGSKNTAQNEAQDRARHALDRMARELRNVAGNSQFLEVGPPGGSDLVFQTVDQSPPPAGSQNSANVMRVRYCHDSDDRVVRRQAQRWTTAAPPASPSTATCLDDGAWPVHTVIAEGVTNGNRPVWLYNSASAGQVRSIRAHLFMDVDTTRPPRESELLTGLFLRNPNGAPTASFTYQTSSNLHVELNGSASADPEGAGLTFRWFDGSTEIGTGTSCDCVALAAGNRSIRLLVEDPGGLTGEVTQTVNVQ